MLSKFLRAAAGGVSAGGITMTAASGEAGVGWTSAFFASTFFVSPQGSASGDFSASGGTIEGASSVGGTGYIYIYDPDVTSTEVIIDGTSYPLTFLASGAGFVEYTGSFAFGVGVTYSIQILP